MLYLIISLISLFVGLILAPKLLKFEKSLSFLDGFVSIFVGGLVLFHIFPHAFSDIGFWALPIFTLGLIIPFYLENNNNRSIASLLLLGVGFSIHAFLDGVGLYVENIAAHVQSDHVGHNHEHVSSTFIWAILAHRLPVGLFLGFTAIQAPKLSYSLAFMISIATVLGYFTGSTIPWMGALQALVGGALLHVISGHRFVDSHTPPDWRIRAGGALSAGLILFVMSDMHMESLFLEIWSLSSFIFLCTMSIYLPKHDCRSCEETQIS